MNGSFAAWFSSWSRQTPTKSRYISSTTGRIPAIAAPTPRPDDRGLGDRRVAHAVAEAVVQPAGEPEHVAARADVDPGDEHPVVGRELGLERVVDRVHRAEDSARRRSGGGSGTWAGDGSRSRPRVDDVRSLPTARGGSTASSSSAVDARLERVDGLVVDAGDPAGAAACRTSGSRASHSCRSSVGPVALRVALVVAVPPVGRRLDDRRPGARRATAATTAVIASAVATTSLPSTATYGSP